MKKIQKIFFIALTPALFFSCGTPSPKGYKKISEGLYYQLHQFGESERLPMRGDYLSISADLRTENNALIFATSGQSVDGTIIYRAGIPDPVPTVFWCIDEGLMTMHEGDSVSFLTSTDAAFKKIKFQIQKLSKQKMLKFNVKLQKIQNEAQYQQELTDKEKLLEDADIREKLEIEKYIKTKKITTEPTSNGFYFIEEKKGDEDSIKPGKHITAHYKASFLNARIFYSTYNEQPLEFNFGEPGQVIKGMEIGLSKMREGGKAKFIIPSQLAFGEKGSSNGQVPPFTTVIYEVEVVNVK